MKKTDKTQTSNTEMVTIFYTDYEGKDARLAAQDERISRLKNQVEVFMEALRLYRQEQEINRKGIKLSRQTMSNWILKATADYLPPVYE